MEKYEFISDNGLKVVFLKTNKFKTISLNLFLKSQIDYESNSKLILLTRLLTGANKKYPSVKEFSSYLKELYDAKLIVSSSYVGAANVLSISVIGLNSRFIKENINEKLFEIINDVLYLPLLEDEHFKTSYFNEQKRIYLELLQSRKDYKENILQDKVNEALGKNTPFGIFKEGDLNNFDELNPFSLYEEYKRLFLRQATLYVVGDMDIDDLKKYINRHLKILSIENNTQIVYKKNINKQENLSFPSTFKQSSICTIYSLPVYKDEIYFPSSRIYIEILNYYLFKIIREKYNFCYSIFAQHNPYLGIGKIFSNIEFKNYEKTLELIEEIFEDLNKKIDKNVFTMAKTKQINNYKSLDDSIISFVGLHYYESLMNVEFDTEEFCEKLNQVKIEDVKKVASMVKKRFSVILKEE